LALPYHVGPIGLDGGGNGTTKNQEWEWESLRDRFVVLASTGRADDSRAQPRPIHSFTVAPYLAGGLTMIDGKGWFRVIAERRAEA
jgi:hypothetical protein